MGRERISKPRKMRPQFLVLCEGETEEAYINLLKQKYRIPIKIVTKIVGDKISQKLIDRHKKELSSNPSEVKTFLMYDGDVSKILETLKNCEGIMLISKPCIEIWFIAHYKKVPETDLSSDSCLKQLCSISGWEQYKKAVLTIKQQDSLWDNRMTAVENMKSKTEANKTYSTVYQFINLLEEEKSK
ncbi:MAG: RloB family protein [Treponema sp.]|nr:RloB family protein [Treponema sp.]